MGTLCNLEEAARQADADAEYDRKDAEERRETPRTPWAVRLLDKAVEILDADGAPVQWTKRNPKTEACATLIVEAVNWFTDDQNSLYAAAPDLYAACEAILVWFDTPDFPNGWGEMVDAAEVALAKARGGES